MHSFISMVRRWAQQARAASARAWTWYRGRKRWQQIAIAALLVILLIALMAFLRSGSPEDASAKLRTVSLASVGELSGTGGSVSIVGTVRSVTEADILAQANGTVRAVHTGLGRQVRAGAVLAELENASERAAVLQAEGAYESALAARRITVAQSGNTVLSREEAEAAARTAYRSAFTDVDSLLNVEVQSAFGGSSFNPGLAFNAGSAARLSEEYRELRRTEAEAWRRALATADSADPEALLNEAERITRRLSAFLADLARAAASSDSGATATQRTNIASARAETDALLASLSNERNALRAAQTAAAVASNQSETVDNQVSSADAQVKSALGSLRAAQAQLEKTIVRAPIAGTVNYLPIRVGDYVSSMSHVATVAQNGALEVIAYVGEDSRDLLAAGTEVTIEDGVPGVVTAVAPALDPTTRQIEVRIAVAAEDATLVNGQSVRVALPDALATAPEAETVGPLLLPLSAVKLRASERIVFTVDEENRLVAHAVEIGEVRGTRIEVLTALDPSLRIVKDARGLSAGQEVRRASELLPS